MYRFKQVAIIDEENIFYGKLRQFILEFFPANHPIAKGENISSSKFIESIERALTFNHTYFCTSFHIEREKGRTKNVYALFFITPNIKGFEKILESKWEMDKLEGRKFRLSEPGSLFQKKFTNDYEEKLKEFLREQTRNNNDLYEFGLKNNHLPKHTNEILKKLKRLNTLEVFDISTGLPNKRGLYTDRKEKLVYFKLKN